MQRCDRIQQDINESRRCTAGAFLFEDVGVTAFHGAINAVTDKQNLALLASIAPIEAYHASILRTLLYQKGLEIVTPYNIRVFDFVQVSSRLPFFCCDIVHELAASCAGRGKASLLPKEPPIPSVP